MTDIPSVRAALNPTPGWGYYVGPIPNPNVGWVPPVYLSIVCNHDQLVARV